MDTLEPTRIGGVSTGTFLALTLAAGIIFYFVEKSIY
jgi:hypothetical protein